MLRGRNFVPFAVQYFERGTSFAGGHPRLNQCIDIAALGGNLGLANCSWALAGLEAGPKADPRICEGLFALLGKWISTHFPPYA
jgi:hypothetical protein